MLTRKQLLKALLLEQSIHMPKLRRSITLSPAQLERHLRTAFYAGRKAAWEMYKHPGRVWGHEHNFRQNPSIQKLLERTGICPPKGRCKCP